MMRRQPLIAIFIASGIAASSSAELDFTTPYEPATARCPELTTTS